MLALFESFIDVQTALQLLMIMVKIQVRILKVEFKNKIVTMFWHRPSSGSVGKVYVQ